jgi:hypothetical protein
MLCQIFLEISQMKGESTFRSHREIGEWGTTPELWGIKPRTSYLFINNNFYIGLRSFKSMLK